MLDANGHHRRSQGVGAPVPPGRRKKFRRNLQGKFVSALPAAHQVRPQESLFRTFFAGRGDLEVDLVVLDRLFRATTN